MIGKSLIIFLLLISILLLSACSSRKETTIPATTTNEVAETQRDNIPKSPEVVEETTVPATTTNEIAETQPNNIPKSPEVVEETTIPDNKTCSRKPVLDQNITGEYKGECKNGLAEGSGIATGKDQYEGQFRKGMMNGKGTYTWANGDSYDGYFSNDKKEGEGIFYEAKTDKLSIVEFRNDDRIDKMVPTQNITTDQQSSISPSTGSELTKFRDDLRPGMMTMQGLVIEVKKPERIAKVQTEGSTVSTEGSVSFGIIEKWMPFSEIHPLRENY